jgi:uncharacterized protein YigA (DUF484 family)
VSLVERQISVLREKNLKLERQLRDLVEVAQSNDTLAGKIHQLALELMEAPDRGAIVTALEEALRVSFGAEQSVLVVFGETDDTTLEHGLLGGFLRIQQRNDADMAPFKTFLQADAPRCGHIRDLQRDYLFGTDTNEIGSAALIPLGPKSAAGFVAIGNSDADYFHPGQSMDFLARLGDLIGCALSAR